MTPDSILLIKIVLFSIAYGWVEQRVNKLGFRAKLSIFDHFGLYHVGVLMLFIIVSYPELWVIPGMILLEDIMFFVFYKGKKLDEDSWVNWNLGGFRIFGQWIPTFYILLFLLTFGFYFIQKSWLRF